MANPSSLGGAADQERPVENAGNRDGSKALVARVRSLILAVLCLTVLFVLAHSARSAAEAQPAPARVPRVGFLSVSRAGAQNTAPTVEAFRAALRAQGYVEGQTISIEYRFSEGNEDRFTELVNELARLPVDVIVAVGTPWAAAAKNANVHLPVVMVAVGDPIGAGLVDNLARPGGNFTGPSNAMPPRVAKKLELLQQTVSPTSAGLRVAVLANLGNPAKTLHLNAAQVSAKDLGIELQPIDVRRPEDIASAFERAERAGVTSIIVLGDPFTVRNRSQITQLARQHRIPAVYEGSEFAEAGGLMSYGPNRYESFRRAAIYVVKILRGAKPADLPVEEPYRFELVLNLKTAQELGIIFPQSLLLQADRVIR